MEEARHPVSGIDYPGTFQDFDKWFSSESACLEFIAKLRWRKGFICPGCGEKADKPSFMGRGLFLCRKCKRPQVVFNTGMLIIAPVRYLFLILLVFQLQHVAQTKALACGP